MCHKIIQSIILCMNLYFCRICLTKMAFISSFAYRTVGAPKVRLNCWYLQTPRGISITWIMVTRVLFNVNDEKKIIIHKIIDIASNWFKEIKFNHPHTLTTCLPKRIQVFYLHLRGEWMSEKFWTKIFLKLLYNFHCDFIQKLYMQKSVPSWVHCFARARAIFE